METPGEDKHKNADQFQNYGIEQQFQIQNTKKWRLPEPPRVNYSPNDGYNRLREYKDVKISEAGGIGADMGLETEPIRDKIVISEDRSVPLDKKRSIGTRERSKTKRPGLPVKKKSLAIWRANKPAIGKKRSNPEKKINELLEKAVKLEKIDPDDPIETEDKVFAGKLAKSSLVDLQMKSKEQVVKDKKSGFETGASHFSKSNDNEIRPRESPHIAKLKFEKTEEPVSNVVTETAGSNDDCPMTTIPNEKLTTRTITNDEDSQSFLASNHQIANRQKSGSRRNIPRSSVMTIWHWLRVRSRHTPTSTKKSSNLDRVQDPFLSLFFPAMIASDFNRPRINKDESEKRNKFRYSVDK